LGENVLENSTQELKGVEKIYTFSFSNFIHRVVPPYFWQEISEN
jgi:hypothetical protein